MKESNFKNMFWLETAAHLVDNVFPNKPYRQWVLSFPFQLRFLFASKPKIMSEALNIVTQTISMYLLKKVGLTKKSGAQSGAVTLIQRSGQKINLNVHFHILYLQGIYSFPEEKPVFHLVPAPTKKELEALLDKIIRRILKRLKKRGLLTEEELEPVGFDCLQAASVTYRIAFGPRAGQKLLTLRTAPEKKPSNESKWLAQKQGFSLHAGVATRFDEKKKLEKICRYITRPAISLERLSTNTRGQVIYRFKKPFTDGSTHIVMEPLELMQKLAALVPRPRVNLIRFHGVFGPHFKYRNLISVSKKKKAHKTDPSKQSARYGMTWAQRLARVFNIDITICSACGGRLRILAAIEKKDVITKILEHLDLDPNQPVIYAARAPPIGDEELLLNSSQTEDFEYSQLPPGW